MTTRLFAAALLAVTFAGPSHAQVSLARDNAKLLAPFKQVVSKANESTVRVRCNDRDCVLGTVISAKGLILTKASELHGKVTCRLSDGTEYEAIIHSVHKRTDLALLKIEVDGLKPATFTDSKTVPPGRWLAAAGPQSDPLAVGIVSVKTRNLTGEEALLTLNANRGFLNVIVTYDDEKKGAKITHLVEDGAAARAGLKENDIIIEVNGRKIIGQQALREALDEFRPDERIALKVLRDDAEKKFEVRLARDTSDLRRDEVQNKMGSELSGRRTGFPTVMQTDMVLAPKDCGGPIVSLEGHVLGIGIARAGRVETWILPSETIRPVLADMQAGKHPPTAVSKK